MILNQLAHTLGALGSLGAGARWAASDDSDDPKPSSPIKSKSRISSARYAENANQKKQAKFLKKCVIIN